jgi:hypothetical protein
MRNLADGMFLVLVGWSAEADLSELYVVALRGDAIRCGVFCQQRHPTLGSSRFERDIRR